MIGPKMTARLKGQGFVHVTDLLPHSRDQLIRWFGPRMGDWLFRRVRGQDSSRVTNSPGRKSVSAEETFATDVNDDAFLRKELVRLSTRVAQHLRKNGFQAKTVTLKLRDLDFTTHQKSRTLPHYITTDRIIYETATELLKLLRDKRRVPVRLIGVGLSNLAAIGTDGTGQLLMFSSPPGDESPLDETIADVMDTIHEKYGRVGLKRGSEL